MDILPRGKNDKISPESITRKGPSLKIAGKTAGNGL
jgi:hypothetical protein